MLSALVRGFDAGRTLRLVCPNPDLVYPTPGGFGIASGAVALILEAALALRYPQEPPRFTRLGKPFAPIFEEALRRSGTRDMVMIGDQLETDIRGARAFGLDAVLVTTGISSAATMPPDDVRPTYLLRSLFAVRGTVRAMPSRIAGFLRNTAPNAYCDYCLATSLGIDLKTVSGETAILVERRDFERPRGVCSYCGSVRDVTTAARS